MNRFEWVNATSVDQALASVVSGSSFKAGGIDLLDLMKDGIAAPPRLVTFGTSTDSTRSPKPRRV